MTPTADASAQQRGAAAVEMVLLRAKTLLAARWSRSGNNRYGRWFPGTVPGLGQLAAALNVAFWRINA